MKKILTILFLSLCLLLGSYLYQMIPKQPSQTKLTLKEAVELAHTDALNWNKAARLIDAISIDSDQEQTGFDGERRFWNITFGLPNTKDLFLVNIHDGKVNEHVEIPNEGDEQRPEEYFITDLSEIKYDSPELLKKAKEITNLYPGDLFAKGYNFGITKDPRENLILVKIIGWDKERKNMKYLLFNGRTGEFHSEIVREQYK